MGGKGRVVVLIAAVLLGLWGTQIAVELTRIHYLTHTDPEFHAVCALSEGVNCETVALSCYSVFLGLPVSVWGIFGYVLMTFLSLSGLFRGRLHERWPMGGMLLLATISVVSSGLLAYISVAKIDSVCVYCIRTYVINGLLFLLFALFFALGRINPFVALWADIGAVLRRPKLAVFLAGGGIVALAATEVLIPRYWATVGFNDLPSLQTGVDENGHHWIGAANPVVTVTEFSDYECPHCRKAHQKIRHLAAAHPNQVRLYHRHLPLDMACHPDISTPFHKRACEFALAAECAGRQGKFWEMNDAIFAAQNSMKAENVDLESLAVRIGVDRSDFKTCVAHRQTEALVASDIAAAVEKGIRGTPTFFIGETRYLGDVPESAIVSRLSGVGGDSEN